MSLITGKTPNKSTDQKDGTHLPDPIKIEDKWRMDPVTSDFFQTHYLSIDKKTGLYHAHFQANDGLLISTQPDVITIFTTGCIHKHKVEPV